LLFVLSMLSMASAIEVPHEHYELRNGLDIILIEDHSLPTVVVDTWYGVGSYDDPRGASGFAHLFEHLMFMGTERIGEGEFDTRMETAGGWNNASTGDDRTNYYDVGPAELLDLFLFMEADRMTGLDITTEKLDLQREVVRNERRQNYEDEPYGQVWLELAEMLYPESHAYHWEGIGSHEHLLAATLETVSDFYADWYSPDNAALCVAGDFDPEHVKARIDEWFGPLRPSKRTEHEVAPEILEPVIRDKTITDRVPLPALILSWHSPSYYAAGDAELDILSDALAGGADARLSADLVQERRLLQELEVFQWSRKRGSVFMVYAVLSPDADLAEVERTIHAAIADIASGAKPLTERELLQARNVREMGFIWGLETPLEKAELLQDYLFYLGNTESIETDLARYREATVEGVSAIAAERLGPEKAARLIVEPKEAE
jgi:zinc protease